MTEPTKEQREIDRELAALYLLADDLLISNDEAHAATAFMIHGGLKRTIAALATENQPTKEQRVARWLRDTFGKYVTHDPEDGLIDSLADARELIAALALTTHETTSTRVTYPTTVSEDDIIES